MNNRLPSANSKAFTLIELLIVVSIIALSTIYLLANYTTVSNTQGLSSSVGEVQNAIKSAHVFAREARDQKAWGVISSNPTEVALVSGTPSDYTISQVIPLERNISIESPFTIWFSIGTGETASANNIILVNKLGKKAQITVYQTGVVDTKLL